MRSSSVPSENKELSPDSAATGSVHPSEGSFLLGWSKKMSGKGFVPLRRGLMGHVASMTGTEMKVFVFLLMLADYRNHTARISTLDLCQSVGVSRRSLVEAIQSLVDGEYITYRPAMNQYDTGEFFVNKYDSEDDACTIADTLACTTADTPASPPAYDESCTSGAQAQASDLRKQASKNLKNTKKKDIEPTPEFEEFWNLYPRRDNRKGAIESFAKTLNGDITATFLIERAKAYAALVKSEGREKHKILMPTTWLNQERFNDESLSKPSAPDYDDPALRAWL